MLKMGGSGLGSWWAGPGCRTDRSGFEAGLGDQYTDTYNVTSRTETYPNDWTSLETALVKRCFKQAHNCRRFFHQVTWEKTEFWILFWVGLFFYWLYLFWAPYLTRLEGSIPFLLSLSSLCVAGGGCCPCSLAASRGTGVKSIVKTFFPWPVLEF